MRGEWIKERKSQTAVVFVHGILSSGEACWLNDNGCYWPALLKAAAELDTFGIYVFTYETGIFSGSYSLSDVVDALKEYMRLDSIFDCRQIIFVCHSMGGIVVRKFLVERQAELIEKKVEIGLFLVASPSLGSSYANLLSLFARVLRNSQADALRFQQQNAWLNDLDKEFKNLKEAGRLQIRGKELIEDKFVVLRRLFRKQVVEPLSGAKYFGEPFKVPLSDHFSIAKPAIGSAIQQRLLYQFTKSLLELPVTSRPGQAETPQPESTNPEGSDAKTATQTPNAELNNEQLASFRGERKKRFDEEREKCEIYAKSVALSKQCDAFGNSTLYYFLEDLTVERSESVTSIHFQVETAAGLVQSPIVDEAADKLGISWYPVERKEPQDFEAVLDSARSISGEFRFRQTLTRKTGPYSFGWSVKIYNMDATTRWEFENLYPRPEDRLHVDRVLLNPPQEYIARLVWLPTIDLFLSVQLPPGLKDPIFRSFDWTAPKGIEKKDVIREGRLLSTPTEPAAASSAASLWESRPSNDQLEARCLTEEVTGEHTLGIPYPTMGSWYSLDWRLKDQQPYGTSFKLMKEAEAVRARLMEYRRARQTQISTTQSVLITELLRRLHQKIRKRFPRSVDQEIFESTLFSYEAVSHRLVVCESFRGEGDANPYTSLEFGMNFGMGLAGACFRAGSGIFVYNKSKVPNPKEPYPYLPCPGQPDHEYLLALPIDHPDFTLQYQQVQDMDRCRQIIGVITVSSDYGPSSLQQFCVDAPPNRSEHNEWRAAVQSFRDECQREIDPLSRLLLGRGE